jgi:hypothetical protein
MVARLKPAWQGTRKRLRRAVRTFILPRRRNLGFLRRLLQTLHVPAIAAALLLAIQTPNVHGAESLSFSATPAPGGLAGIDLGEHTTPAFGDLDGDGDLDVLSGDEYGEFIYFENTGTSIAPAFAPLVTLSGLSAAGSAKVPAFGDLDGDGDLDVLAGDKEGTLIYCENTGTTTLPAFAASTTLSGLADVGQYSTPSLGDIDGDGDLDVLTGEFNGDIYYFENVGDVTSPAFTDGTALSGLTNPGGESCPEFIDLDGDGDLDVLSGRHDGLFLYFENTGDAASPAFAASVTLAGLDSIGGDSCPALGDLDGDGDLDVLTGGHYGQFHFFEHGNMLRPRFAASTTLSGLTDAGNRSSPTIGDLDGDGDLDIIAGNENGRFVYFENTGTVSNPLFQKQSPLSGLDVDIGDNSGLPNEIVSFESTIFRSDNCSPTLGDLDGDGDLDLIAGDLWTQMIWYYENTGSVTTPVYDQYRRITGLGEVLNYSTEFAVPVEVDLWGAAPELGDMDDDGDLDLLTGVDEGLFFYSENVGSAAAKNFSDWKRLNRFDSNVGSRAVPALADMDNDGDLDLLAGNSNGGFVYFQNSGGKSSAQLVRSPKPTGLSSIKDDSAGLGVDSSSPAAADMDGDGDMDVIVGKSDGKFTYFENTSTDPDFAGVPLVGLDTADVGDFSAPILADLDGDGDLDILSGDYYADFMYFENTGTAVEPAFAAGVILSGISSSSLGYYSTPALGDLDGDGDLDLLTGEQDGKFFYFENFGTTLAPSFVSTTLQGFNNKDVGAYSKVTLGDVDSDGDLDLLTGNKNGQFRYLENTGTATHPAFAGSTTLAGLTAINNYSAPALGDVDGDGDLDVITGRFSGQFGYFVNVGTATEPLFIASKTLSGLSDVGQYSTPAFGDLDGDGNLDVVAGNKAGTLSYFENTGD